MTDKTAPITRYCFRSEGMSDPPEQFESPTGDVVDYWDHLQREKELLARIESLEAQLSARQAALDGQWKCGNEYLLYHPSASHVHPAYRDGWNDCYRAAPPQPEREPLTDEQIDELCGEANRGIYIELDQYLKAFRDAERAHGIGATND